MQMPRIPRHPDSKRSGACKSVEAFPHRTSSNGMRTLYNVEQYACARLLVISIRQDQAHDDCLVVDTVLLGGSGVVISRVISPLIWVISIVTLLISLLITTHEPPSKNASSSKLKVRRDPGFRGPSPSQRPWMDSSYDLHMKLLPIVMVCYGDYCLCHDEHYCDIMTLNIMVMSAFRQVRSLISLLVLFMVFLLARKVSNNTCTTDVVESKQHHQYNSSWSNAEKI